MSTTSLAELQPSAPPPPLVSFIVKCILRSPFHRLMSKNTLLLTLQGKKSGKVYTIPVLYAQEGKRVTIFTGSPWQKNLRGGAPVTVTINGREVQGIATPLLDDKELFLREHVAFLQKVPSAAKPRGIRLDAQKQPNYDDVVRTANHFVLIEIQLAE